MPIYKGIEIDDSLAGIIRFMHGVEDYREVLGKLQSAWDILVLLGQLTGAAAEMSGTREGFQSLTGDLLTHLGKETQHKAVSDLRAKAQISIDILVRNLFERTADIGFLSADDDIRQYLQNPNGQRSELEARFQEYVRKYSVYSDIILFDVRGHIRARLKPHELERSRHFILDNAKTTGASYLEFFGDADFLPPGNHLVYAYRVEDQGQVIGTLALVFRLENEMQGVFSNLLSVDDCTLLATVTSSGEVVATSSPIQLPVGSRLPSHMIESRGEVVRFSGREFLAMACSAHGYQGYAGPDWKGVGLVPLDYAFERINMDLLGHLDPEVLAAVMSHPTLFSESLRQIPIQAEGIQENLNRSVWNGSVKQVEVNQGSSGFAKTLLWEISNTGRKTQAVFEQSIGNLHQTVVAALLQQSVSRASFAIDVMDRNLYERANDCRWWALTATFSRVLSSPTISPEDQKTCGEILAYINGLYTVYDSLILFDNQGRVVAVSKPDKAMLVGGRVSEPWVEKVQGLAGSQGYVASEFLPTALYGQKATYVYAAAIRHATEHRTLGGIGIVFDSQPQFAAMLHDALPMGANGQPVKGAFALFLHRDGSVIASSDERFPIGSKFPLEASQRRMGNGERQSSILQWEGHYYALGLAMSAGYREYKTSDGHDDDVIALCAFPLGEAVLTKATEAGKTAFRKTASSASATQGRARRVGNGQQKVEMATFYIGNQWLGIPATDVVEAIDVNGITPTVGGSNPLVAGVKVYRGSLISVLHLQRLINPDAPLAIEQSRQIIVLNVNGKVCMGLLVDELGEIPEIAAEEIQPMPMVGNSPNVLTVGVVQGLGSDDGADNRVLSIIGTERFCTRMGCDCKHSGGAQACLPN